MRIAVLSSRRLGRYEQAALEPLLHDPAHRVVGAVLDDRPRRSRLDKLRFHLRRGRGGYVLVMALKRAAAAVDAETYFRQLGVPVFGAREPHGAATTEAARAWHPDVVVLIGGFGILREPWLSLAPLGTIAYHHGDMRRYRGQPPCFWELYRGERSMGATVQRLAEGLDAGTPIVEQTFAIRYDDTLGTLRSRVLGGSVPMLAEAVARLESGKPLVSLPSLGRVYSLPNLRQWLLLHARVAVRRLRASMGAPGW